MKNSSSKTLETLPETTCEVKTHFDCDGCGMICTVCGESGEVCNCDDGQEHWKKCVDCDGTGRLCMTHESPVGDTRRPLQCDVVKKRGLSEH